MSRALLRLWGTRGFFGGLVAFVLAALGQQALIERQDQAEANRYYIAAILLLIVSLLHPALPRLLARKRVSAELAGDLSGNGVEYMPTPPDGPNGQEASLVATPVAETSQVAAAESAQVSGEA